MKIFVSGGSKSGKSLFAQTQAKAMETNSGLYYVATMAPFDNEDNKRIARHVEERSGWGFTTVEQPRGIEEIMEKCNIGGVFLIDSLTALLTNEMFSKNGTDLNAHEKILSGLDKLFKAAENIVTVSDYIYSDAYCYDEYTEGFRRSLSIIDRFCAENSHIVIEFVYGNMIVHKGFKELNILNEKLG